jgi:hypothetical protein
MIRFVSNPPWKRARVRPGRSGDWLWSAPFVVVVLGVGVAVVMLGLKVTPTLISAPLVVCGVLATLLDRLLDRRRSESDAPPTPKGLSPELLERWRVAVREMVAGVRVEDGGQLAAMVRSGDPIDVNTARVDHDCGRPRVRVGDRLLPWSEITRRWDSSPGRLVILGDPGYGKTVAALTLVKHINSRDEPGVIVAELFSLAEWQRWRGEHPNAPLGDWLAQQLTVMHPQLPVQVARELVAARLIVPVLDGLDEIASVEHRRACVAAIDAYAGRGEPHRPFVLTCRAREYRELAPEWVRDDDCVMLIGLQPDQIRRRLNECTAGRSAWNELRTRQAAGDTAINELFCSPLRLAIALQVYERRDPGELIALTSAQRRAQLWELLLQTNAGYRGATGAQTRAWLAWLATGMHRTNRQRFMLHELYLLDPDSPRTFRVFRIISALAVGLGFGLAVGLGLGLGLGLALELGPGLLVGLLVGMGFGLVFALVFGLSASPRPSVRTQRRWRERMRHATRADALVTGLGVGLGVGLGLGLGGGLLYGLDGFALVYGLVVGLIFGLIFVVMGAVDAGRHVMAEEPPARLAHAGPGAGLAASRSSWLVRGLGVGLVSGLVFALVSGTVIGLLIGLVLGLSFLVMGAVSAGRQIMAEEPPARLAHAGPGAGLVASRSSGLVGGLVVGLIGGLVVGLIFGLEGGLVGGLVFGPVGGLSVGLVGGLVGGLDAWLYHHWLRWRLSARGVLPTKLPAFLEWCAQDERGWLRISDAYEFRHRELLEHLAPTTSVD